MRAGAVRPASYTAAESAGFATAASADIADLANRREQLRAALLSRAGARIVIDLAPGAEPLRVRRFDPVNLMVLAAGQVAHPHYLTLESPEGAVDLDNPGYVRGAFDGTVGLTAPAGRHPLSAGIRQLIVVGATGEPVIADESGAICVDAPGLRIRLRGSLTREAGGSFRITLGERP